MKNKKGQALVEFIIIMPVLMMVLFAIIDFGNIFYKKYELQNDMDYIIQLYRNDNQYEIDKYSRDQKIKVAYDYDNEFTSITVTKRVKIITPGLNIILGNPYDIVVRRVIANEI